MTVTVRGRNRTGLITSVAAAALTLVAAPVAAAASDPPTVTKIVPNYGATAGGTHVTVRRAARLRTPTSQPSLSS